LLGGGNGCQKEHLEPIQIPDNAIRLQDAKIGDRLWSGSLEDGIQEYIIIAIAPDGRCLIVEVDDFNWKSPHVYDSRPHVAIAMYHRSLSEAVAASAQSDLEYHAPRAEYARKAMAMVKAKKDLTPLIGGFDFDE